MRSYKATRYLVGAHLMRDQAYRAQSALLQSGSSRARRIAL
ncbi:MAG TPA: hypothetical protein PLZ17_09430 [Pseudomonadota bacterium]|nr:hypothetical protein [Pseudomonadota bacterium]